MKTLVSIAWGLSGALQNIALLSMLAGIFFVGWAVVQQSHENEDTVSGAVPRAVWASPSAKFGFALFFIGLTLDMLLIGVRLLLPGRL